MSTFHWTGIADGSPSSGDIQAENMEAAKELLKAQKIIFTDLQLIDSGEAEGEEEKSEEKKYKAKRIKKRDLMIFTKKLATMIQSGLPILKAIKMLEDQTEDKNFKAVIHMIYTDIEAGSTLSDAFEKHPAVFDTIYINLLRAGETSGKLTVFLYRLVIQIEKAERIRQKIKSALTYPIILISTAIVVILVMLIKVVPVFEQMFSSVGHSLPGPTAFIISISNFLREPAQGGILFIILVGGFCGLKYMIKSNEKAKHKFHETLLKIPLVKDVIQRSTLAKISMIEGNLSAAGVSVLESLDIISRAVSNLVYKDALAAVKKGVSEGKTLSQLYSEHAVFPSTFCQMLAVGEETGNMDDMFETTANYYEEEFDMTVNRMTEMLEPMMIVFMGLTIGFIIVAMYLPIFQIGQTMMPH